MANSSSSAGSGGIGFLGLLFIVFLVLKLTHTIDWSWWWVTCPLWGPMALAGSFILLAGILAGIGAVFGISRK